MTPNTNKVKRRGKAILLCVVVLTIIAAAGVLFRLERTAKRNFEPIASSPESVVFEVPISIRSIHVGGKPSPLVLAEAIYFGPYFVFSNEMVSARRSVKYSETNGLLRVTVDKQDLGDGTFQLVLTNRKTLQHWKPGAEGFSFRLMSRKEIWTSHSLAEKQTGPEKVR